MRSEFDQIVKWCTPRINSHVGTKKIPMLRDGVHRNGKGTPFMVKLMESTKIWLIS